ncbi:MAG: hypothetical protein R2758_14185 [Bacteroidales bacterium]
MGHVLQQLHSISAGKKIIKWGKTDIFTPLSRFNPVDYTFRTPDFEDGDMGNLLGELTFTPAPFFRLSVVATPVLESFGFANQTGFIASGDGGVAPRGIQNRQWLSFLGCQGRFPVQQH